MIQRNLNVKKNGKIKLVVAVVGAAAASLFDQASADELRDAFVQAYITNPELRAARAGLRANDELVAQALAAYRPVVTAQGLAEASDTKTDRVADSNTNVGVSLDAIQQLYSGGGRVAAVEQAEALVRAERAALLGVEQELLQNTATVYSTSWQDRATLQLARNNAERLQRQLQATQDRFEVGEVARTDVAQAQARVARANADIEQARANLASSLAAYRQVVGEVPDRLEEPQQAPSLPGSEDEALEMALSNPLLLSAEFQLEAARKNIDVAMAELLPDVSLRGSLSYVREPSPLIEEQRDASVGLTVTVPLYQGGLAYSQVRQSRQTLQQRQQELESRVREVRRTATESWRTLEAARAAIDAFRSEVRANEIALQGVQEEANVGQRTTLDVLDAEQELFQSRINLVQALANQSIASYQLKASVGDLTARGLELEVEGYDPEANYDITRNRLFGLDIAQTPEPKRRIPDPPPPKPDEA